MCDEPNQWCSLTHEFRATISLAPEKHPNNQGNGKVGGGGIDELVLPNGRRLVSLGMDLFQARFSLPDLVRNFILSKHSHFIRKKIIFTFLSTFI
jgi:hypothetical protein